MQTAFMAPRYISSDLTTGDRNCNRCHFLLREEYQASLGQVGSEQWSETGSPSADKFVAARRRNQHAKARALPRKPPLTYTILISNSPAKPSPETSISMEWLVELPAGQELGRHSGRP